MKIAKGSVVALDYRLHLGDGVTVDASEGGEPLQYIHGEGQIVPGLETALEGLEDGATRPEEGGKRRLGGWADQGGAPPHHAALAAARGRAPARPCRYRARQAAPAAGARRRRQPGGTEEL